MPQSGLSLFYHSWEHFVREHYGWEHFVQEHFVGNILSVIRLQTLREPSCSTTINRSRPMRRRKGGWPSSRASISSCAEAPASAWTLCPASSIRRSCSSTTPARPPPRRTRLLESPPTAGTRTSPCGLSGTRCTRAIQLPGSLPKTSRCSSFFPR